MFVIPQNEAELEQMYKLSKSILKARTTEQPADPCEKDPIPGEWSLMDSSKLREETKAEMSQKLQKKGKELVSNLLKEFNAKVFSDIKDEDLPIFRHQLSKL